IMWFSESWKQHNLAQVNCLSQQTKQKLSQDNLFPSLLSLLDVKTQGKRPLNPTFSNSLIPR
ncbi:hypothetical protein, partial [Acinetobacter baumannii]